MNPYVPKHFKLEVKTIHSLSKNLESADVSENMLMFLQICL